MSKETLLYSFVTEHEQYHIVDRTYEGRPARVLFSGNQKAAQSGIALDDNPDLLFDYNQRLLEITNALYPKRILVIGGGAFTLPMALTTALPDSQITVLELDDRLQEIAEQYFGLQTSENMKLEFQDGRQYLEQQQDRYDLIIVDVFSDLEVPRKFLTHEWIQLLRNRLLPGGSVAMNIIACIRGHADKLLKSQIAAYNSVFDRIDIYPAAHGLTSWLPQNLVIFAQTQPVQEYKHYIRYAAISLPSTTANDTIYDQ